MCSPFCPWRVGEKGYIAQKKLCKNDPEQKVKTKRLLFCRKNETKTGQTWKSDLQAVGDFKDFTWYPKKMRPRFHQLRASWTYMTMKEKKKTAFLRPKKWFLKKQWSKTKTQKVFGLTTSNGRILCFCVGKPFTAKDWAKCIEKKVAPFLKRAFPERTSFTILLDGEQLLHEKAVKKVMKKHGIQAMKGWPGYSPDLNPQENVWSQAEPELRRLDKAGCSFEDFGKKCIQAVKAYPSPEKLVASMAKRCKKVIEKSGGMCDKGA